MFTIFHRGKFRSGDRVVIRDGVVRDRVGKVVSTQVQNGMVLRVAIQVQPRPTRWQRFRKRILRYRLRTLLGLFALCAVLMHWVITPLLLTNRAEQLAQKVQSLRGWASIDHPPGEVVEIHLARTKITDEQLEPLLNFNSLVVLDISGNPVTDATLSVIARHTRLRDLYANETQITDAGLRHLESLADLRYVDLRNTTVTAAGIARLQLALPAATIHH